MSLHHFLISVCCIIILQDTCISGANNPSSCEKGWVKYNNHCYYFHTAVNPLKPYSWEDSRLVCQYYGGELVKIDDSAEQSFLNNYFTDPHYRNYQFWIGYNDLKSEGNFTWVGNNDTTNYTNWRNNEPSNSKNNEHCVETHWDGKWNDNDCSVEFSFVCEKKIGAKNLNPTYPPYPNITDRPTTCEAGWIPWGTSCYGVIRGIPKTWKEARSDCLRRFGDLVDIDSQQENDFLTFEIKNTKTEYWIGLTDTATKGKFVWVDGSPLNDSLNNNWRPGEPSNSFGNEDCVEMYGHWLTGKWNDNHCNSIRDYICEKKSGTHNCPDGWFDFNGYCYEVNAHPNQKMSWEDARQVCLSFNKPWKDTIDVAKADLVSITSKEEKEFLDSIFQSNYKQRDGNYYWIGLKNNTKDKKFHWNDESILTYHDWIFNDNGNGSCVKSSLNPWEPNSWKKANCDEEHFFVCKVKRGKDRCYDPVGMQDYRIPDSSITASSTLFISTPPYAARLFLKKNSIMDGAWCSNDKKDQWLQIDFGKPEKFTYLAIQGKSNSDAMVTKFKLMVSMDGISWDFYGKIPPARYYEFVVNKQWRKHNEKLASFPLLSPFKARYARIYPLECHVACCLRVEFYGCPEDPLTQECGHGWHKDERTKHCYRPSSKPTTWDYAEKICDTQGSHLVSIESKEDLDFLNKLMNPLSGTVPDYWTGLNDLEEESVYTWSDQTPLKYSKWYLLFRQFSNGKGNCVAAMSKTGQWFNTDCTKFKSYICKKSYNSPYVPKMSFNNYWATSADYFWKMDKSNVSGTIPASTYGSIRPTSANDRKMTLLNFDGSSSYLKVGPFDGCASHPGSNFCPHGLTVVFSFVDSDSNSYIQRFIIDSLGTASDVIGYHIYFQYGLIKVYIRSNRLSFQSMDSYSKNQVNQFAMTWSVQEGLKTYINGEQKTVDRTGSNLYGRNSREDVTSIFIGRSATNSHKFTRMQFGSLALFERALSTPEITAIYLAEFGKCAEGQIEHGSHCYQFVLDEKQMRQHRQTCQQNGGELASIHSSVENAFIALKTGGLVFGKNMWLGLKSEKDVFSWTDGSPLTYMRWKSRQANFRSFSSCIYTTKSGVWDDYGCYMSMGGICKYTKVANKTMHSSGQTKGISSHTVSVDYFYRKTFSCAYPKKLKLDDVTYGSEKDKCFLDKNTAMEYVKKTCTSYSCRAVASDYFFGYNNPCKGYTSKKVVVKYSCIDVQRPNCGTGYELSDDDMTCYKLHLTELNISDAMKKCQEEQANLASISSSDEQLYLTSMLSKLNKQSDVWVGLKYEKNMFTWMDNTTVTFTKWYNRKPDTRDGSYVKVGVGDGRRSMFWVSANGNQQLPFFCKKYAVDVTPPTLPTTTASDLLCPAEWITNGNNCYFYNNRPMSFVDASTFCTQKIQNGHLASVLSADENKKIREYIYNVSSNATEITWFGLTNEAILNGFRWTDNSPVKFLNWMTDHPYSGNRHFCAGMNINGYWIDSPCFTKYMSICKVSRGQLPPTTTTPPTTPTQDPTLCPTQDWIYVNESCYYFSKKNSLETKNYYDALKFCEASNGSLASILNKDENDFILREKKKRYRSYDRLMIGLEDHSTKSGWRWTDNSILKYVNFADNEPSKSQGMESCVEMYNNGRWNDFSCNIKTYFVCKWHKDKQIQPTKIVPKDSGYCEDGWQLYGKNCYLIKYGKEDQKTFDDARAYCNSSNSKLASIHSNNENAFILSQLQHSLSAVFIGMTDFLLERTFIWTDESPVDYTNWYYRQPDSYGDEDCVELKNLGAPGKWNDIDCKRQDGFVCKKASIPNKPTGAPVFTTKAPTYSCVDGFKKYSGSCYYFSTEKKTWDDAQASCKAMKADLVSIHSHFEQAYVFSQFVENSNESWIGLSRGKSQTSFSWSDKLKLSYSHWKDNNVPKVSNSIRYCVAQLHSKTLDGSWSVYNCNTQLVYACKITVHSVTNDGFIGNCSKGWEKFQGKCYKVFTSDDGELSWPAARQKCITNGGDLATVDSFEVSKKMQYLVRDQRKDVWIGLNDRNIENVYQWSSGIPYSADSFSYWNEKEPNNKHGTENCVEMNNRGRWNDLNCNEARPFICEHPLECREPMGFENGRLSDNSFSASSYYGEYLPQRARINAKFDNKDIAWCTNRTTKNEFLEVDLGEYQHITRINTQGMKERWIRNYVISYQLQYSKDGKDWSEYVIRSPDGSYTKEIPANTDTEKIEGNIVDIRAQYLKFNPVLFLGNLICLRLEVYGCQSVCLRPLTSMASQVTSNSKVLAHLPTPFSEPLCIKEKETFNYQLSFEHRVKISRVEVKSTNNFISYYVSFRNKDKKLVFVKDNEGDSKVFSTATKAYDMRTDVLTHEISIKPLVNTINQVTSASNLSLVCLNIELFGCVNDCDIPFGLQSGEFPDSLISAKTELPNFPAAQGRLNTGLYNENSWCPQADGSVQYIQFDFTKTVHLTGIATQGHDGDIPKYVTRYIVQWSSDGDLWMQISKEFEGNQNGKSVAKVTLDTPITTRYLRIIPRKYTSNGVCMRIEFYGCPFKLQTAGSNSGKATGNSGSSSGLSEGGKIGIIVFFVIILIAIFVVAGIYYIRRRNTGFDVPHKSFENPVHVDMTNDEVDIINYGM